MASPRDFYNKRLKEFLTDPTTHGNDKSDIVMYMDARLPREPNSSYIADLDQRQSLANEIYQIFTNYGTHTRLLNWMFWSILMVAPLDEIRKLRDGLANPDHYKLCSAAIRGMLGEMLDLVKIFFAKPLLDEDDSINDGRKRKRETGLQRDQKEVVKCKQRDSNQCIITGTYRPEGCHIFPFASLQDKQRTSDLLDGLDFWGTAFIERLKVILTSDDKEKNITDTARNMLSLNRNIHEMWSKGMVGFEPLPARGHDTVELKVHWFPRTRHGTTSTPSSFDLDPLKDLPLTHPRDNDDAVGIIRDMKTGRLIQNGHIITITSKDPKLLPDLDILSLQWDLIRITYLSGAADMLDEFSDDDSDDDSDDNSDEEEEGEVAATTELDLEESVLTPESAKSPASFSDMPL